MLCNLVPFVLCIVSVSSSWFFCSLYCHSLFLPHSFVSISSPEPVLFLFFCFRVHRVLVRASYC